MKTFISIFPALVLTVCISVAEQDVSASRLTGTWRGIGDNDALVMEFRADGTMAMTVAGENVSGRYRVIDDSGQVWKLDMHLDGAECEMAMPAIVDFPDEQSCRICAGPNKCGDVGGGDIEMNRPRDFSGQDTVVFLRVDAGTVPVSSLPKGGKGHGGQDEAFRAYVVSGGLADGVEDFGKRLAVEPENDDARLALGVLQALHAAEDLGQAWYKYGLGQGAAGREIARSMPFLRVKLSRNPGPEPVTHEAARGVLERLAQNLAACDATLAGIKDPGVALEIPVGLIAMDFDKDGAISEDEYMSRAYGDALNIRRGNTAATNTGSRSAMTVRFDAGDVKWLRGYCNLLGALLDFYLAHDDAGLFKSAAHLVFKQPEPYHDFLLETDGNRRGFGFGTIADVMAMVHQVNLPVTDPDRLEKALAGLKMVVRLSRESWSLYMAETDNDKEWIPNPGQEGAIPGMVVTTEMVDGWNAFLDELELILEGRKLAPFWRGTMPRGINVARFFKESRRFDLVLFLQGVDAAPYLEDGQVTDGMFWRNLMRLFGGNFMRYAFWFN